MWSDGPIVLGIPWQPPVGLIQNSADLAATIGVHLVCAFVDPESYLTEHGPADSRIGVSLDPAQNREADFPPSVIQEGLQDMLGPPGREWTFRVLNGDVPLALMRLADSAGASMLIVGGPRPGRLAGMARLVEGSVSMYLIRSQPRPVVVFPHLGRRQANASANLR